MKNLEAKELLRSQIIESARTLAQERMKKRLFRTYTHGFDIGLLVRLIDRQERQPKDWTAVFSHWLAISPNGDRARGRVDIITSDGWLERMIIKAEGGTIHLRLWDERTDGTSSVSLPAVKETVQYKQIA